MPVKKTVKAEVKEEKKTAAKAVKETAKKTAAKKTTAAKKEAAPKKETAKKAAAPKKETAKKTTAKKEAAPKAAEKKTTAKKTAAKKTTTKKTAAKKAAANYKSVKDYVDVINWKKGEAHAMDWLYIEVNAGDLLTEVEAGADNMETCAAAVLECMLEGDGFINGSADTKTAELTVRYYCDNLSEDRKKYFAD